MDRYITRKRTSGIFLTYRLAIFIFIYIELCKSCRSTFSKLHSQLFPSKQNISERSVKQRSMGYTLVLIGITLNSRCTIAALLLSVSSTNGNFRESIADYSNLYTDGFTR